MSPQTWLGVLALLVGIVTLVVVVHHNRRSQEDVSIRVLWPKGRAPEFHQQGERAEPVELRLSVTNFGGTRSRKGRLVVTLKPGWRFLDSPGWEAAKPNSAMGRKCDARETDLPRISTNDPVDLPPFRVEPKRAQVTGGAKVFTPNLRWEAFIGRTGANADDLRFSLRVSRR